ncbi:MAG: PIN domain-containing protein [Acidobacteriota bacterium]|jgi:predicted nucleic acid-binding protein|nr:PIN domain-containing protein [Acidobacteriota bacterium]
MSDRVFFDTNILVYLQDDGNPRKQGIAKELFEQYFDDGAIWISEQVLKEFCNVALKKLGIDPLKLKALVEVFIDSLNMAGAPHSIFAKAIDIHIARQYSFYDSLVIASAAHAGCSVLYTEDMQDGDEVQGVRIANPFQS